MEITRIILRVTDMQKSIAFWSEEVGLEVVFAGGPFTFLDGGGVQLALNEVDASIEDPSMTEIVFEVDDIVANHADLQQRGVPFEVDLRPVTTDGDRDLLATHFRDPDGHLASITGWVERN